MSTKKTPLDVYLLEIHKQFIAIKDDNIKKSQEVFKGVFEQVKEMMSQQCNYFKKYSRQILYGGSVADGIKVSKMDEFDMDIVIRLPINYEDGANGIIIENDTPGFVKLKIINAFDNLVQQQNWEACHKVTRDWRDSEKYFLQKKFRQWMHGVVQKAINALNGKVVVNETIYLIKYKESGPAFTLNIVNSNGNESFKLDVDLVPVIRFQHPRWPDGYRTVEGSQVKDWLVVPKPNKLAENETLKSRCWRLSFQDFEREMIQGCNHLKPTIKLVKKLRDSLEMKCIASYYIKTIFLWKIYKEKDKIFWQKKISVLFLIMLKELYMAIKNKNVPYFWQENNNLIEKLKPSIQAIYVKQLSEVIDSIEANLAEKVCRHLLRREEWNEFQGKEFYQIHFSQVNFLFSQEDSNSNDSVDCNVPMTSVKKSVNYEPEIKHLMKSILDDIKEPVLKKLDMLIDRVEHISENITKVEICQKNIDTKITMLETSHKNICEELKKKCECDMKSSIMQLQNEIKSFGLKCNRNSIQHINNTKHINEEKQNIQNLAKEMASLREDIKYLNMNKGTIELKKNE